MVSTARLIGGLMTGLGTGIQLDGKAKYERMLSELEHSRRLELEGVRHGNDMEGRRFSADADTERQKADQTFRTGESDKDRTFKSEEGEKDHRRRLEESDHDYSNRRGLAAFEDDLDDDSEKGTISAEDARVFEVLENRFTAKDDYGDAVVDYGKVGQELRRMGRNDLARLYGSTDSSGGPSEDDPLWNEAQTRADAWVDSQAGLLSSDEDDFKDYGGNREEARQRKALEFYDQLKSRGGSDAPAPDKQLAGKGEALPSDRSKLKVGTTYQTSQGPAKYLGNGQFEAVD
jgi:hypothetical protein